MSEHDELRRLAALAAVGDLAALGAAVELAERLLLEQELANAPSGVRTEALAGIAALWKQRRAKTNRSKATAASNKDRGEHNKAMVEDAAQLIGADTSDREITGIICNHLKRNGKTLSENTIRKTVKN